MTNPVEQRLRRTAALVVLANMLTVALAFILHQLMEPGACRFFATWVGGMAIFALCYLGDRQQ